MGRGCVVWPWLGRSGPRPPFASATLGLRFCWCRRTVLLRGGLELTTWASVRGSWSGLFRVGPWPPRQATSRQRRSDAATARRAGRRPSRPAAGPADRQAKGPPPGRRPKGPPSPRPRRGRGLLSTGPATRRPPTQPTYGCLFPAPRIAVFRIAVFRIPDFGRGFCVFGIRIVDMFFGVGAT